MDVTVLLSTWNNSGRLEITLQAFTQCMIPQGLQWELVVINNNCTDNTDEIVKSFSTRLPINYVKEPQPGLSKARNAGLKAATGRLIIFTDDDVKPSPEWIRIYWDAFQKNPQGRFWGGPIESEFEGEKPDEELLRLAPYSVRGLDYGPREWELPAVQYFISANWAVPREALQKAGGFDVNKGLNPQSNRIITGEESDLMDRLRAQGMVGVYLPLARLRHWVPKEKCTLQHIVARCEAGALESYDKYRYKLKKWTLFQRPVGMYVHICYQFFRYVAKRMTFKKAQDEYIKLRIAKTVTHAFEQKLKSPALHS